MPRTGQDLERLQAFATAQGGVVSPADLGACGFSAKAVRRRINEGTWHRVGGAIVLAPGHSGAARWNDVSLSWILRLTFGPQTRISGALALRRARWHLPHETHVVVLKDKPNFGLSGVTVLRRPDTDADDPAVGLRFVTAREALADATDAANESSAFDAGTD